VGYGLVTGLQGTGDRVVGGSYNSGFTVRTIANLLGNLGVDVPEQFIRSRNAAAVLVTAEASPFLRAGTQFDVTVSSLGDASSLRGGSLYQTPMFDGRGSDPVATAQGSIAMPPTGDGRDVAVETSAMLPDAGQTLLDLAPGTTAVPSRLLLRKPDLATAQRIANAINGAVGDGTAAVEDPGSVALQLPADDPLATLVTLGELQVTPDVVARVVIDARSGAVAAGGNIRVGPAMVSHDWLTLTIGPPHSDPAAGADGGTVDPTIPPADPATLPPGAVRAEAGVMVHTLAEALHAVGATSDVVSAVFQSLRRVGALQAEIEVR
jgi:flagellar P-ring protein precursor FlgI